MLGASMIGRLQAAGLPEQTIKDMGFSTTGKFTADYTVHAFVPSIGVSYSF